MNVLKKIRHPQKQNDTLTESKYHNFELNTQKNDENRDDSNITQKDQADIKEESNKCISVELTNDILRDVKNEDTTDLKNKSGNKFTNAFKLKKTQSCVENESIDGRIENKKVQKLKKSKSIAEIAAIDEKDSEGKVDILVEKKECVPAETVDIDEEDNTVSKSDDTKCMKNKSGNKFTNAFKLKKTQSCVKNGSIDGSVDQFPKSTEEEKTKMEGLDEEKNDCQEIATSEIENKKVRKLKKSKSIAESAAAIDKKDSEEKIDILVEKKDCVTAETVDIDEEDNAISKSEDTKSMKNKSGNKFTNAFKLKRTQSCVKNGSIDESVDQFPKSIEEEKTKIEGLGEEKNDSQKKTVTDEIENELKNKKVQKLKKSKSIAEIAAIDEKDSEGKVDILVEKKESAPAETVDIDEEDNTVSKSTKNKSGNKFTNAFKLKRTQSCVKNGSIDESVDQFPKSIEEEKTKIEGLGEEKNDSQKKTVTDEIENEVKNKKVQKLKKSKSIAEIAAIDEKDSEGKVDILVEKKECAPAETLDIDEENNTGSKSTKNKSGNKFTNAFKLKRTQSCVKNGSIDESVDQFPKPIEEEKTKIEGLGEEKNDSQKKTVTDEFENEVKNKKVQKLKKSKSIAEIAAIDEKDSEGKVDILVEKKECVPAETVDIDEEDNTVSKSDDTKCMKNKSGNKFTNVFKLKRTQSCVKNGSIDESVDKFPKSIEEEKTEIEGLGEEKNDSQKIVTSEIENKKVRKLKKSKSVAESAAAIDEKDSEEKVDILVEKKDCVTAETVDIDEEDNAISKSEDTKSMKNKSGNKFTNAFKLKRTQSCVKNGSIDESVDQFPKSIEEEKTKIEGLGEEKNDSQKKTVTDEIENEVKNKKVQKLKKSKSIAEIAAIDEKDSEGKVDILVEKKECAPAETLDIDEEDNTGSKSTKNKSGNKFTNAFKLKRTQSCVKDGSSDEKVSLLANVSVEEDNAKETDSGEKDNGRLSIDTNTSANESIGENTILDEKDPKETSFRGAMKKVGQVVSSTSKVILLTGQQENISRILGDVIEKGALMAGEHGAATGALIGSLILPGVGTAVGRVIGGAVEKAGTKYVMKKWNRLVSVWKIPLTKQ